MASTAAGVALGAGAALWFLARAVDAESRGVASAQTCKGGDLAAAVMLRRPLPTGAVHVSGKCVVFYVHHASLACARNTRMCVIACTRERTLACALPCTLLASVSCHVTCVMRCAHLTCGCKCRRHITKAAGRVKAACACSPASMLVREHITPLRTHCPLVEHSVAQARANQRTDRHVRACVRACMHGRTRISLSVCHWQAHLLTRSTSFGQPCDVHLHPHEPSHGCQLAKHWPTVACP